MAARAREAEEQARSSVLPRRRPQFWGRRSRGVSITRMSGLSLVDQPSSTMVVICGVCVCA